MADAPALRVDGIAPQCSRARPDHRRPERERYDSAVTAITPAVEREQLRVALLSLGCSLAQGFLFSPAVPHEEITAMLLAPPAAAVLPLHVLRLDGPSPKDASLPA